MKKIAQLLFLILFLLTITQNGTAAELNNATSSAGRITPTPQKLIDKQIQNLKDKIATKVAELSKSNQQVLSGLVSKIDEASLTLQNKPSEKILIDADITEFFDETNLKNNLSLKNIKTQDYLVVFGVMLGNEFTAKTIVKQNEIEFIEGTIKNIEKKDYSIEIITADQETITIDIEKNTIQKNIDEKTVKIIDAGFSNYTIGARMQCVIIKRGATDNRGSALRTLIIPQQLTE